MIKVAFTAFRNDLAFYLEKLSKGEELQIINARRNKLIVGLVSSKAVYKKTLGSRRSVAEQKSIPPKVIT
jgi:hypothetical protein